MTDHSAAPVTAADTPAPWRTVYLALALAVANGHPAPVRVTVTGDRRVQIGFATGGDMDSWSQLMGGYDDADSWTADGTRFARGSIHGWHVLVWTDAPTPVMADPEPEIAEQLEAALAEPDPDGGAA